MKISETQAAVPGAATRIAQGSPSASKEVEDKVSVSRRHEEVAVEAARASVAAGRADRVQEIVAAVRSGQYYPSPQQIAQKLVSEAEVEARLRALMAK
ncbi:MAG: flagellar biosynthesis anti-sigma factor FlgM [Myxococcaceae bacterium]